MRCDKCPFLIVDYYDSCDSVCGIFGYDFGGKYISEDKYGNMGCKFNHRTLLKFQRENDAAFEHAMQEEAKAYEQKMLEKSRASLKSGIIKIAGI